MEPVRVVVVGSCMIDVVVRAPRLPVVGETVVGSSVATFVGGKGNNQAIAAARLGTEVALIGKVGRDAFGDQVVAFARSAGVDCRGVVRDPLAATGVAVPVVFDDGGNSIFAVPQANMALTAAEVVRHAGVIRRARVLLLQFEVPMAASLAAAEIARASGIPVVVNTAPFVPPLPALLAAADFVVANETEAAALAPDGVDHVARARAIAEATGSTAIVTLGQHGVVAVAPGREAALVREAFPVRAVDSVGAGDAFCGALGVALAEGRGLEASVRFAQAAGALSVTREGAAASLPTREEVDRFLSAAARGG